MAFPQYDEKLVTSVRQTLVESASGKSPVKFASLIQTLENNVATRAKMYVNFQETLHLMKIKLVWACFLTFF